MKIAFRNRKLVIFVLTVAGVLLLARVAGAQAIAPRAMRCLGGAVEAGKDVELVRIHPGGESTPFIVPAGYSFVLTDIVVSPQLFPPDGWYSWGVNSTPELTTALVAQSSAAEPSSFQIHLNTGMVFRAGSKVRFGLTFGATSVNVSAYGYLAKE